MGKARSAPDVWILISTLLLLTIGVVMVYSASAVIAYHEFGDYFYYLKRQLLFAVLGIIAMFFTMNMDYHVWKKYAKIGLIICFALLIIVLIPGIGVIRGGARSWLGIGSFGIQPSEFMKMGMILFLAKLLSDQQSQITSFTKGLLPPLVLVGVAFGLIMLQPDLGTGAVMVGASLLVIFTAGARILHLSFLAIGGIAGFVGLILAAPYRLQRITAFLDPWQDPLGAGYQAIQSLYAIGPGGLVGLGLGMSRQKYSYLPEPQTDFIFSIIAEELGFIGGMVVLLLFLILVWRGMRTAITAPDTFSSLVAVGIVGMVAVQVIINIGVVIGLMPVTGITLPLISAGGSSLTLMLTSIGILLNISRYAR
ncbi:stage V sporulation protein E [Paenibacillus larvae]|uniref:Stage V sporulation protein E n=2 Tax=Paenibacillus larvae TaxID=1464 RepID=A0A2L1TLX9_9BACL|nr:stage V sporulation protein E [Paenibacillus larvae]AQT83862.1 stage V sporulation protein E [Paenibacillus larvae subsp. pulvifaciens]AVF21676.1 stage V sporulation protein E [Paenibacillus larvae subsp. larvae]AVF27248.1 stage V sporulation protein E [Paenibacillus larvae subsp. larvae]AVF31911.1 stage V sporulation protein E [Paenibacillus larvae subsp. larvae]ETK27631.1 stage V sporulation protein E [Paenibacillus larvae subsp. larvae DSM 25719]